MSEEPSGGLDVTVRDFASGQKVFNRYTLIRILGRGGMGIVWLARDEVLDRDVALKFLPEIIIHDRAVLDDLKRETKRSLQLTHKNVVRIYDFVQDEKSACISMEYVDGETLSNLRVQKHDKVFEPSELMGWVQQLCDAVEYAHVHERIVHCDLKPSNLMVNSRGILKVTDFGIARSLIDSVSMLTTEPRTSGTLVYMSPQQLDGEKASHSDDIYSIGATLYELLASKPPFYRGQIDRQIRERTPPSMAARREELDIGSDNAIPMEWEQTIAACLAKNPTQRPKSAAEIALRLCAAPVVLPAISIPKGKSVSATKKVIPPRKLPTNRVIVGAFWFLAMVVIIAFAFSKFNKTGEKTSKVVLQTTPVKPTDTPSAAAKTSDYELAENLFKDKQYGNARVSFEALLAALSDGDKIEKFQLLRFKIYLTLLLEGEDSRAQKLMEQFQSIGDTPALYYAQAAWEFKHNNPNKAKEWIASATKIYSTALIRDFSDSFRGLGWTQDLSESAQTGTTSSPDGASRGSPYESSADFAKYSDKLREQAMLKTEPRPFLPTTTHAATTRYQWKTNIVTTVFWIGEKKLGSQDGVTKSAWDSDWLRSYGGIDDPDSSKRRSYIPVTFVPKQNPFYCALPYNDVTHGQSKPEAAMVIPWFRQAYTEPGQSVCKDRWLAVRKGDRTCYAQWEDCGPFRTDHFQYVFQNERPTSNPDRGAGLRISPAIRDYLGLQPIDVTDWQFVEVRDVPQGPWRNYGDNNHFVIARRQTEQRLRQEASAGAALADRPGVVSSSPLEADSFHNDTDGIPQGSVLGITEVKATEIPDDPNAETSLTFRIAVKKRPDALIDHTKVKIQGFFYDTENDKEVFLTDADVNYEWITPKHDWKEANPEVLQITYVRLKNKPDAAAVAPGKKARPAKLPVAGSDINSRHRKYLGYIFRVYYNDQLQAVRADPTKLLNLFPPPFTAPSQ